MLLRDLPPLLREEPGFASVLGRSSAVLAVPEPARALTIAGLATLTSRRPLVVALPTSAGKTRVAEIAALMTLSSARRVLIVTPLRAPGPNCALRSKMARSLTSISPIARSGCSQGAF